MCTCNLGRTELAEGWREQGSSLCLVGGCLQYRQAAFEDFQMKEKNKHTMFNKQTARSAGLLSMSSWQG